MSLSCCHLQAYFPKSPGNFGQHYLANGCPHAQMKARYLIRTLHKRPPIRFFFGKNVGVARSQNSPRKRVFSLHAATPPSRIRAAATAALSENFGRGATFERDFSLGFKSSEKLRALCQRNSTEQRAEARFQGSPERQSERKTDFSRFF